MTTFDLWCQEILCADSPRENVKGVGPRTPDRTLVTPYVTGQIQGSDEKPLGNHVPCKSQSTVQGLVVRDIVAGSGEIASEPS